METTTTAITIANATQAGPYCSFVPETPEQKKALYNAMTRPDHKFSDYVNREVKICNVFVEGVEMVDATTGETFRAPRIVLIDDKGESYAAVSSGVYRDLVRICQVYGNAPWDGLTVRFIQTQIKDRRVYGLDIV